MLSQTFKGLLVRLGRGIRLLKSCQCHLSVKQSFHFTTEVQSTTPNKTDAHSWCLVIPMTAAGSFCLKFPSSYCYIHV